MRSHSANPYILYEDKEHFRSYPKLWNRFWDSEDYSNVWYHMTCQVRFIFYNMSPKADGDKWTFPLQSHWDGRTLEVSQKVRRYCGVPFSTPAFRALGLPPLPLARGLILTTCHHLLWLISRQESFFQAAPIMLPHLPADGRAKSVRTAMMVQRGQLEEMDVA